MKRDSMLIYRSFYEAIKELKKENQADVWAAVHEYGLNRNEIELKGISVLKTGAKQNVSKVKANLKLITITITITITMLILV